MALVYIRELKHHSKNVILEKLGNDEKILNKLLKYNFVKIDTNSQYVFDYVGVLIIGDMVINVYPKYVPDNECLFEIKNHFKQVIKVIKKDSSSNKKTKFENKESEDISFNLLSLMIFFIEDYYQNGLYTNLQEILEINGNGEVHWDKTINNTYPILDDNKPHYVELQTRYKRDNIYDYFRLLHEYIITECSKFLEKHELLEIFSITPIELNDKTLNDFGDKDFILENIRKELNVEFNTRKQKLLHSMYSYLSQKNPYNDENFITNYGTTSFYDTWENVCCKVLGDVLEKPLEELELPTKLNEKYGDSTLISLIEKPKWNIKGKIFEPDKTLIPDLITIYKDEFRIYDAKYYLYKTKKDKIEKQPGITSVTKQYLYELAYKDFIADHNFKTVINGFLFPNYEEKAEIEGFVELNMLFDLDLKNLQIIKLPVKEMYALYLKNKKTRIELL